MYDQVLERTKESDLPYLIRILRWVAFSLKLLMLAEIADIAAIDVDREPGFDCDEVLQDPREFLKICPSFVTVLDAKYPAFLQNLAQVSRDAHTDTVILTHCSVKEYLMSKRILRSRIGQYDMQPAACHRFIAMCCIHYQLQYNQLGTPDRKDWAKIVVFQYSVDTWASHARMSKANDHHFLDFIITFLTNKLDQCLRKVAYYDLISYQTPPPMIYACEHGLVEVVRRLLSKNDVDIDCKEGLLETALSIASRRGYLCIARLLIEKGANVNATCQGFGPNVHIASAATASSMVEMFMRGGKANDKEGRYDNALQGASMSGNVDVVKLLIESGARVNEHAGYNGNALQAASYCGSLNVIKLLVEKGADVNAQGGHWGNALLEHHTDVADFLISQGAIDTTGPASIGAADWFWE